MWDVISSMNSILKEQRSRIGGGHYLPLFTQARLGLCLPEIALLDLGVTFRNCYSKFTHLNGGSLNYSLAQMYRVA